MADAEKAKSPPSGSTKTSAPVPLARPEHEPPRVLKETALASSEFVYARMSVTLPVGWTIEDALKPELLSFPVAEKYQFPV